MSTIATSPTVITTPTSPTASRVVTTYGQLRTLASFAVTSRPHTDVVHRITDQVHLVLLGNELTAVAMESHAIVRAQLPITRGDTLTETEAAVPVEVVIPISLFTAALKGARGKDSTPAVIHLDPTVGTVTVGTLTTLVTAPITVATFPATGKFFPEAHGTMHNREPLLFSAAVLARLVKLVDPTGDKNGQWELHSGRFGTTGKVQSLAFTRGPLMYAMLSTPKNI